MTADPAIIEAAARALDEAWHRHGFVGFTHGAAAKAVLAVVTPMIEAAALENAAKVAEDTVIYGISPRRAANQTAAAIRALKEQP